MAKKNIMTIQAVNFMAYYNREDTKTRFSSLPLKIQWTLRKNKIGLLKVTVSARNTHRKMRTAKMSRCSESLRNTWTNTRSMKTT